jgi:hypothetical protein
MPIDSRTAVWAKIQADFSALLPVTDKTFGLAGQSHAFFLPVCAGTKCRSSPTLALLARAHQDGHWIADRFSG